MVPFGEAAVLLRRAITGQDDYGNDVYGNVEVALIDCAIWPRMATEQVQGRDTSIVGLTLLAPPGTTVEVTDRIRVRGVTWEIDGEPGEWTSPLTGTAAGVQVALTRAAG